MTDRYTLLAVLGLSPQVLTETVYALHRQGYGLPESVHVVTTRVGAQALGAVLFDAGPPAGEEPHRHRGPGWDALADALGADLPPVEVVAPTRPGEYAPLEDIVSSPDSALVADAVYQRVHDLTAAGSPPLVASIAGGRKTMSADLQSAFSLYARPSGDRLVHILVSPPDLERTGFLFPGSVPDSAEARLTLVDVQVPRLRRALEAGPLLEHLPSGRDGLRGVLGALEPFNYTDRVARAGVALRTRPQGGATLRMVGPGGDALDALDLPARAATTLAVLADALERSAGPVPVGDLLLPHVDHQRANVREWSDGAAITSWLDNKDVSNAVSDLWTALKKRPRAKDAFEIERLKRHGPEGEVAYAWAGGGPPSLALDLSNAARLEDRQARWSLDLQR